MSPLAERLSQAGVRRIRDRLVGELGGYLRNVIREPGVTCTVCAGPIAAPFVECHRCRADRLQFGGGLAELVVPVCYGIKGTQSGHLMWMYKDPTVPVRRHRTLLTMLLLATLAVHERCIVRAVGRTIDAWAVVPSTGERAGEHPLRVVARGAGFPYPELGLSVSPRPEAEDRATKPDRFTVDSAGRLSSGHVLVVDDTWATGARSQSAALALKDAGAGAVTILVLARWLNPHDHAPTADFVRGTLTNDYDPLICPVSGRLC